MKTVTLKARGGSPPTWHDAFVLQNAIGAMSEGASLAKNAVSLGMARKLYLAMVDADLGSGKPNTADILIKLKNAEGKILWKGLQCVRPEQLGRDLLGRPAAPNMAHLAMMLIDLAADLGETIEEPDEDEDDE